MDLENKKIGMAVMLIGIMLLFANLGATLIPKFTFNHRYTFAPEFANINMSYYCNGCHLSYELDQDYLGITVQNISIGVYGLYFGEFRIFQSYQSPNEWYNVLYFDHYPGIFDYEEIEFVLFNIPQYTEDYIIIGEFQLLDNISVVFP